MKYDYISLARSPLEYTYQNKMLLFGTANVIYNNPEYSQGQPIIANTAFSFLKPSTFIKLNSSKKPLT